MSWYGADHIPFLYALAREFTVCDRWFSVGDGTDWPNRFYLHAPPPTGTRRNLRWACRRRRRSGSAWPIAAGRRRTTTRASCPGTRWRFPPRASPATTRSRPSAGPFLRRRGPGSLPNLAIIDPDFEANDATRRTIWRLCEAFVASVYRAMAESPQWSRSLLVINFDEHGGFYDHVAPPQTDDPDAEFRQLGFRVPAIVVGPTVWRGRVVSTPFEHVSIAATLKTRFGIASLGRRMDAANDLSSCLDRRRSRDPRRRCRSFR
jgi:phospholipase C